MFSSAIRYSRCICEGCNSQYATVLSSDEELKKETCPNCGAKRLKIVGPLSDAEINSMFYSGG